MFARLLRKSLLALMTAATAAAGGVALAQTKSAAELMPLPGEARLTLTMGDRSVAFPTRIAPLARETIPFEANGHAVTEAGRQAVSRLHEALFRQPGGSLVIVVYGENEALAFQRARAVRGELAERHSLDPARIVATGRKTSGHAGDASVVDVYGADATRCGGCGASTFRSIALDSATLALVTSFAEALPAARMPAAQPEAAARPAAAPPARPAARPQPAEAQRAAPAAPRIQAAARPATAAPESAGCPRPRIIIDDYYPGGPIVPCRAGR
jgi:hypothetical protein